jgi:hypothetical protein
VDFKPNNARYLTGGIVSYTAPTAPGGIERNEQICAIISFGAVDKSCKSPADLKIVLVSAKSQYDEPSLFFSYLFVCYCCDTCE